MKTLNEKIEDIRLLTEIHEVNTSRIVYLPELVEVGHLMGESVYVNSISGNFYSERITAGVLFNQQPDDFYGTSFKGHGWLTIAGFECEDEDYVDIVLNDDWLNRIYDTLFSDEQFLATQLYHRENESRFSHKSYDVLGWEKYLMYNEAKAFIDKYQNHFGESYDLNTYNEMVTDGEEKYIEKCRKRNETMMKIMGEMDLKL
ncbi:hypothetical protein BPT24_282 [Tenacibaculum phage pT24]|uniref:Uncharacterized protein n=1 Tax=Tenacibaculum phage pT24 TaxID=1880590 RepID=A0A1B4XX81_9CAUD|nr:hypothetical protein HYP10_gp246 [Tenacibaculum phage pT24]BAV39399.1 hypothetical protein BPT24_282 [Tenacibaculum phage pT24]